MAANKQRGHLIVAGRELAVTGRLNRVARLHGEYHEYLDHPEVFLETLRKERAGADLFTFLQPISDRLPRYDFPRESDLVAVLPIDTYDKWWKQQVNDKTRNMARKAGKKGVVMETVEFNDELVRGIQAIYNECPLRQGKPFKHYGKDFDTLKEAHASYLDRSVFICASLEGRLIGFIKMIMLGDAASIMQIISLISERDKAPTNALLAKAVEICAERGVRHLQYGVWSRRSMGDFKKHNGFEPVELPRYFVPLTWRGRIALALKLHHGLADLLPGNVVDSLVALRARYYANRYKSQAPS